MNDEKKSKWNQFVRSNFLHAAWISVCASVIGHFIAKAIEKYGGMNLMEWLYQSFIVDLWHIWFGISVGLAYLVVWRIVLLNKFLTKGLDFDDKLNELGVERRELMTHVNNSYNGLSRRLDKIEKKILQGL